MSGTPPFRPNPRILVLRDEWAGRWWRLIYCTRHGHKFSAFGSDVDDYCMNCGSRRAFPKICNKADGMAD